MRHSVVTLTILAIALLLALLGIESQPMWIDESITWKFASSSWVNMFGSIFRDAVHPPLHYVVVKLVLYSGAPGIWAIRIPSIAAGLGTVFVLSRFALRYPEQRGAIYAAMLGCAVNDHFLRAMQMGRAYALETFLIVLLLYMVLDPVPRPQIILVVAAHSPTPTTSAYSMRLASAWSAEIASASRVLSSARVVSCSGYRSCFPFLPMPVRSIRQRSGSRFRLMRIFRLSLWDGSLPVAIKSSVSLCPFC